MPIPIPLSCRFWSKVDVKGPDECWRWLASYASTGYGQIQMSSYGINISEGKDTLSKRSVTERCHRVSWFLIKGTIPMGMCVCHRCDNKWCVNPNHLFLATQQENLIDKFKKGRTTLGRQPNAKLTKEIVVEIKRMVRENLSTKAALARKYGVSRSAIKLAVQGKNWRDVP